MIIHELKERLKQIEKNYDNKEFFAIVHQVKKKNIKDDELLRLIASIRQQRFKGSAFSIPAGNLLWFITTGIVLILAFIISSDFLLYLSAFILMVTLHPVSHYITGKLLGIRFIHYYLNGPARIEPSLMIDYFSYLKASHKKRAMMHVSGVIGTMIAPLIIATIALNKGAHNIAVNLFVVFLALIIFELLTSTRKGDLSRAKREWEVR